MQSQLIVGAEHREQVGEMKEQKHVDPLTKQSSSPGYVAPSVHRQQSLSGEELVRYVREVGKTAATDGVVGTRFTGKRCWYPAVWTEASRQKASDAEQRPRSHYPKPA